MNKVLEHIPAAKGKNQHDYLFDCPGCKMSHGFNINGPGPIWKFNGDMIKPTISPSLLVKYGNRKGDQICHSFIRDGNIQFLNDCTHDLAGQTVPIPEFD